MGWTTRTDRRGRGRRSLAKLLSMGLVAGTLAAVAPTVAAVTSPAAADPAPAPDQSIRFLAASDLHFASNGSNILQGFADSGANLGAPGFGEAYSDLGSNGETSLKDEIIDHDSRSRSDDCVTWPSSLSQAYSNAGGWEDSEDAGAGKYRCSNVTNVATLNHMVDTMQDSSDIQGILLSGDLTRVNTNSEWNLYHTILDDQGDDVEDDVYDAIGNHDTGCNGNGKTSIRDKGTIPGGCAGTYYTEEIGDRNRNASNYHKCSDYLEDSVGNPLTAAACPAYSWNFGNVHFVNLMTGKTEWREDDGLEVDDHGLSQFLAKDLLLNAADGKPVVLMQHYGLDNFSVTDDDWWDAADRQRLWNIIAPYNVVLMLSGHEHEDFTGTHVIKWTRPEGGVAGPAYIPDISMGAACNRVEDCAAGDEQSNREASWYDITMSSVGNQGKISVTEHREKPEDGWDIKFTNEQRAGDLQVMYANAQGTTVSSTTDLVTNDNKTTTVEATQSELVYSVRKPTRVAVDSSTVTNTNAQLAASGTANVGPYKLTLTGEDGAPLVIGQTQRIYLEGASSAIKPTVSLSATRDGAPLPTDPSIANHPYIEVPAGQSSVDLYYGDTQANSGDDHDIKARLYATPLNGFGTRTWLTERFGTRVHAGTPELHVSIPTPRAYRFPAACDRIDLTVEDAFHNVTEFDPPQQLSLQVDAAAARQDTIFRNQHCQRFDDPFSPIELDTPFSLFGSRRIYFGTTTALNELTIKTRLGATTEPYVVAKVLPVAEVPHHAVQLTDAPTIDPATPFTASNTLIGPFTATLFGQTGLPEVTAVARDLDISQPTFASAGATTPSTIVVPAGQDHADFWIRLTSAGAKTLLVNVTCCHPGEAFYDGTSLDLGTVVAGPPASLDLRTGANHNDFVVTNAGVALDVALKDQFGNAAYLDHPLDVQLSSNDIQSWFADTSNVPATAGGYGWNVTFDAGQSATRRVWYYDLKVCCLASNTVEADGGGALHDTQDVVFRADAPAKAVVVSAPKVLDVNQVGGPFTITLRDRFDNPVSAEVSAGSDNFLRVNQEVVFGRTFYEDANGPGDVALFKTFDTVPASFWYSNNRSGTKDIALQVGFNTGRFLPGGSLEKIIQPINLTVDVRPGPATKLRLDRPASPTVFTPDGVRDKGPFTLVLQDKDGSTTTSASPTTIAVAPLNGAQIEIATSPGGVAVDHLTIPAGSSSVTFWMGSARGGDQAERFASAGLATLDPVFSFSLKHQEILSTNLPDTIEFATFVAVEGTTTSGHPVNVFRPNPDEQTACQNEGTFVVFVDLGPCTLEITAEGGEGWDSPMITKVIQVVPRHLTVTASSATTTYGDASPTIEGVEEEFPETQGLASGWFDDIVDPVCSSPVGPTTPAGTYASTCTSGSGTYIVFDIVDGTVTVNKKALAVTTNDATRHYGEANPTFGYTATGFVNGEGPDVIHGVPMFVTGANATSVPGDYPVNVVGGLTADNYSFEFHAGALRVTKAPLLVTATSATRKYGDPSPVITPMYAGFANGDGPSNLTTRPTCSSPVGPTTAVGPYVSTCTGGVDESYAFAYIDGSVVVEKALPSVSVTVTPSPSVFGIAVTLTATVTGATSPALKPGGTVTFTEGTTTLGTATVGADGKATLSTAALQGGSRTVKATYNGDARYVSAEGTKAHVVQPAPTKLTVKPLLLSLFVPSATLIRPDTGAPIAGQQIVFTAGGVEQCRATTNTNGVATCSAIVVSLVPISAAFAATNNYQAANGSAGLL